MNLTFTDLRREYLGRLEAGEVLSVQPLEDGGMAHGYAIRVTRQWHKNGLTHIARWERNTSGPPVPFYAWGEGEDAPKPRPHRARTRCRKWRVNNPDKVLQAQMRKRARRLQQKPPAIDPLMAALMGVRT